jgi:flagella basal body P-ring formation protein FlgA
MISSARLALLLAAAPLAVAGAQVPAPLASAVATALAAQWSANSSEVRLEWGGVPGAAALTPTTPFRVLGRGTDGWYVALFQPSGGSPVALRVRAGTLDTLTVAARRLPANATLAAEDIRREARLRWGPPAAATAVPGEGWVTRRPLAPGDPLTEATVLPPQMVKAGDAVHLEWRRAGIVVALEGVALGSGALGQTVRVRLAERGGQRSGRVVGPGAVRIDS